MRNVVMFHWFNDLTCNADEWEEKQWREMQLKSSNICSTIYKNNCNLFSIRNVCKLCIPGESFNDKKIKKIVDFKHDFFIKKKTKNFHLIMKKSSHFAIEYRPNYLVSLLNLCRRRRRRYMKILSGFNSIIKAVTGMNTFPYIHNFILHKNEPFLLWHVENFSFVSAKKCSLKTSLSNSFAWHLLPLLILLTIF